VSNRPFIAAVHPRLKPQTYLEIGVDKGHTLALALSTCRSVGVDPAYTIVSELDGDYALVRSSSDEFFGRDDPLSLTGGRPFDFTFVDGLHLFEFALRDFAGAERLGTDRTFHLIDDVLPRTVDEAARDRHTYAWAGDVFHLIPVLRRYRPDLFVLPLTTTPTGMLAVFGADPTSTVLRDSYDEIMAAYRSADPQQLDPELLAHTSVVTPERFFATQVLEILSDETLTPDARNAALIDEVRTLGEGFIPPARR
jgi:hypothetical protein